MMLISLLLRFVSTVTRIPGDSMKSLGFLGENKVTMRMFSEDLSLRDIHSFGISFYLSIASSLTSSVSCKAQNAAQDW